MAMYRNGFDFINGELVQTMSAEIGKLHFPLPEVACVKPHFDIPRLNYDSIIAFNINTPIPKLFDVDSILVYNASTQKYTAAPDLNDIETTRIPIPLKTVNGNFVNGASPRFSQVWRDDNGAS